MFEVDAFVIRGHEKVLGHFQRLRDSAKSETERQRLQTRIDEESNALHLYIKQRLGGARRAA
jgi:hypothetical protein